MHRLGSFVTLSVAVALATPMQALAVPGDLDETFNGTGKVVTPIESTDAEAAGVVRQADGKLVAVGFAKVPIMGNAENLDFAVVRYDEGGMLDPSFGGTGIVKTAIRGGDDQAQAVVQQTDGKLVVAGLSYDGPNFNDSTITVVRYLDDGTPDPMWGGTGKVTTAVGPNFDGAFAVIQQADLKIVVAGYSGSDVALVRYDTSGSLDMTFNGTGKVTTTVGSLSTARALVQQAGDDKLVVAGTSDGDVLLARYGTTGTLDGTFGGGVVTASVGSGVDELRALVQQAGDGKLVAAGVTNNGGNDDFLLVRYGLDGMPDGMFGTMGVAVTPIGMGDDAAFGLAQQDDGALVAAGSSSNGTNLDFALVRYDGSGTPDATFGSGGVVTTAIGTGNDVAAALLVQPNGGIVAAGKSSSSGTTAFALARYLSLSGTTTSTSTITTTTSATVTTTVSTTTLPASTTTTTLATLVPGGPATKTSSDCYLELRVGEVTASAVQKSQVVTCQDGAPCDHGPCGDGVCEVEIAACANQTDPTLSDCRPPATLDAVKINGALSVSTSALLGGPACTSPVRVQVPVKRSKAGKYLAGKSKIVIKGSAKAPKGTKPRKDTDKWTIQCVPPPDAGPGACQ